VADGMEISTNSPKVMSARKTNLELLLSNHNRDCMNCYKSGKCSLQKYTVQYLADINTYAGEKSTLHIDDSNPCIVRDDSKCILCGKCVAVCDKIQHINAITKVDRGFETSIGTAFKKPMADSPCIGCGQCTLVCPVGALTENLHITKAEEYLSNKSLKVGLPRFEEMPTSSICPLC
jgi:NADH dehydrogenase/NADH:ubiquinone oxidoreductase subunit G